MTSGLVPCAAGPRNFSAAAIREMHANLPLSFEKNTGQAAPEVKFLARSQGYTLSLSATGAVLQFPGGNIRVELPGAGSSTQVSGLDELPGKINYFLGNDPDRWRTNIPAYRRVRYRNVHPGVDLVYYGAGRQLEFDFILAPHTDPGTIQLLFEGAQKLTVNTAGDLVLQSGKDTLLLRRPVVYQQRGAEKHQLQGAYALSGKSSVGFQVKAYDPGLPLVIDPVLDYSTYLGGANGDTATAIAVDGSGNMYLAGWTYGDPPDFPLVHPLQPGITGQMAIVSKLDPSGGSLVYSTCFGSAITGFNRGGAVALAMAVDGDGNAYVAGATSAADFPVRNAAQRTLGGPGDAFVLKLDSSGSALLYSTYVGGPKLDEARAIAVDSAGRAYIAGSTTGGFPTTSRAFQPAFGGGDELNGENRDAFVARLNPGGSALEYATYLGGNDFELANGIAVDAANNAYVTGFTRSLDFPLRNPLQGGLSGGPLLRTRDGGNTWSQARSGLPSGFVGSLAVDPRHPSTLYAAGWSGIYRSIDGGDSWNAINTGLGYLRIAGLAIDPSSSRVYASTFHGGLLEPPSALYVSLNQGDTWRPLGSVGSNSADGGLTAFALDPSNPSTLYVAHSSDGVLKSTDAGATWRATGLTGGAFQLLLDPISPATLYAARNGGVSKSIDGGDTWFALERVSSLLAIDPVNPQTVYGSNSRGDILRSPDGGSGWSVIGAGPAGPLVVSPSDPATLYAAGRTGLSKSADGGKTWILTPLQASITALAIDPTQPGNVFVGTSSDSGDAFVSKLDPAGQTLVYSTYIGGRGWDIANAIAVDAAGSAYITGQTDSPDFTVLNAIQPAINPGSPDGYAGTDAFVAKLNPAGSALEYATYLGGGANDAGQAIAVDAAGNAYVAGTTGSMDFPVQSPLQERLAGGGRIFKSTDSGATWSGIDSRLNQDVYHLAIHPASPSVFFTPNAGRSEDGGLTWRASAMLASTPDGSFRVFAFDRNDPRKVYAGGVRGVFVSADRGDTWHAINNGLPDTGVRALAIDPSNPLVLYAGGDQGIYKTSDAGENWETIHTRGQPVYALAVAPSAPSRLYAIGFGDYLDKAAFQACLDVLGSDDAGATWSTVKKSVVCLYDVTPDFVPELSVMVDSTMASTVYVISQGDPSKWDASVSRSTDGGATFQQLKGPGYEPCVVTAIITDPKTPSTLYAGGSGVIEGRSTGSACVVKSVDSGETWQSPQPGFGISATDEYGILTLAIDPVNPATLYATVRVGSDAWVAKLNPAGSALLYSTYLGGGRVESAAAIAVGAGGTVYVVGSTSSTDFPTVSPLQGQVGKDPIGSAQDLFLVRIKE